MAFFLRVIDVECRLRGWTEWTTSNVVVCCFECVCQISSRLAPFSFIRRTVLYLTDDMMLFNNLHQKDVVKCLRCSYNERNEMSYESYVYDRGMLFANGLDYPKSLLILRVRLLGTDN